MQPDPAFVGDNFEIFAGDLPRRRSVLVDVAIGAERYTRLVDTDTQGGLALQMSAGVAGEASVELLQQRGRQTRSLAHCRFEVVTSAPCGDGACAADESCESCALDCGDCPVVDEPCGDGVCAADESCTTCAADCGACEIDRSATGIWVSSAELASLPTSGPAWEAMLSAANRGGTADVSDQNSDHDTTTLAAALVCARLADSAYCDIAREGLLAAIGTEDGGRWLAVGRNVLAYTIAADVLALRSDGDPTSDGARVEVWLAGFLTRTLSHNNDQDQQIPLVPFQSGSNASAQEGAVHAAIAAYLGDDTALERSWDAFRTYACDPSAPDHEHIDLSRGVEYGWAHDDGAPCAVNPAGTSKDDHRIDGAIINDMRRGGAFAWPPGYTSYPWVGLEGFVPAALILHRAGYPAFEVADRAVLRAAEYLWHLRSETGQVEWFDGRRADEVVHLINAVYGRDFPQTAATGPGRTVGFTDWTHPEL